MNVILYFSDQQRYDTINETVTPNIDAMLDDSIFFDNAFTCQPVCGPARACIQTGVYATQNRCYINGISMDKDNDNTIAKVLNRQGYNTSYIGKWHLASDTMGFKPRFNVQKSAIPQELRGGYNDYWLAADCLEFTSDVHGGYMFDKDNNKVAFEGIRSDCINDFAIDYIDKYNQDKPFFLMISQLEPHHQNTANTFQCAEGEDKQFENVPYPADLVGLKGNYKAEYARYLACCKRLDKNFADIIQKVKDKGIWDDTIIIYTSDHGCHFKTRNLEYKRSAHDASTHLPFVMTGGGLAKITAAKKFIGKRFDGFISLLDLTATILEISGAKIPEEYQSQSILPMLEAEKGRDHIFLQISESQLGRAIITDKYTYSVKKPFSFGLRKATSKIYKEDLLYDNTVDPAQHRNLIKDKNYKEIKNELKAILLEDIEKIENVKAKII
ncbi:MAG: sulfatase-like hydrolase/transferase [Clostridia bacterium]|nr:sulfatase-like hydrolase/transferase [Clostridia bacterium]MDE7328439.1 sulfatase-like hydrolase/transferase [Clostridia bacterium]